MRKKSDSFDTVTNKEEKYVSGQNLNKIDRLIGKCDPENKASWLKSSFVKDYVVSVPLKLMRSSSEEICTNHLPNSRKRSQ